MLSFKDGLLYELYTRHDVKRPALWIYTPQKIPQNKNESTAFAFQEFRCTLNV